MAFHRIGTIQQLPPGSVMEAAVGEQTFAVCNVGGELHALEGVCPHRGGPLGQGAIHDNLLVCPWHAWQYDCFTGANSFDPDLKLAKFPVTLEGDEIFLDVP